MNVTQPEIFYSTGEKAGLPLVLLPCALLSIIMFKYGRRRLMGSETMDARMINFYSAIAGGILGQFFFHAQPNSTISSVTYSSMSVFIFVGFYVMMVVQKCSRVNHEIDYYTTPQGTSTDIQYIIDSEHVQENSYYKATDLESAADQEGNTVFAEDMWTLTDEFKMMYRRRIVVTLFYLVMLAECILEGFYLVYHKDSPYGRAVLIVMFFLNRLLQTFIINTVLMHGMLHVKKEGKRFFKFNYAFLAGIWCVACTLSTLPALTDISYVTASLFLHNPVTSAVYAFAGGVLFWIALYFVWIDRKHTNKRETVIRLVLFLVLALGSYMTGFFL